VSTAAPAPAAVPGAAVGTESVLRACGLQKRYGHYYAVAGIDLEVARGEIFAFLGPNGAGKTTTVEILQGHRSRDGGEVSVLGCAPQRQAPASRGASRRDRGVGCARGRGRGAALPLVSGRPVGRT